MLFFVLRRVIATVPVMAAVAIIVFLMLRLAPGDPVAKKLLDDLHVLGIKRAVLSNKNGDFLREETALLGNGEGCG